MAVEEKWGTHISMPWREWILYESSTSRRLITFHTDGALTWNAATSRSYWYDEFNAGAFFGKDRTGGNYDAWIAIFKPLASDFEHDEQLNTLHTVGARFVIGMKERTIDAGNESTQFMCDFSFITGNNPIDWTKGSGYAYDGVNPWDSYPIGDYSEGVDPAIPGESASDPIIISELPREYHAYINAKSQGGNVLFDNNDPQMDENETDMFRNGFRFETQNFYYGPGDWTYKVNNKDVFTIRPNSVRIYYMNAIVNSLSRYHMTTAGGVRVQFNGLAFSIPEQDLRDYCYGTSSYAHETDKIHFIGREGQGTYTLEYNGGGPSRDFDVTNTAIVIPSMPAMAKGSYYIQLEQFDYERGNGNPYLTYAGDWRTNDTGRARIGTRHVFVVGDVPTDPPVPYFRWRWKYDDWLYEYYAPIDVRGTDIFWDGRVLGVSSLTRAVDDRTGLFNISDPTVELANHDMHFSRLLSKYICKNQMVAVTYGFGKEPPAWHEHVFFGMVDDHDLQGPNFSVQLKDWLQKYFKGQLPRFIIDTETYPDAKDTAIGQPIPELLGEHSHTTGTNPGAIEALCVDTINYIYVMARGPLRAVPQVYSDGTLVSSANYTIYIEEDGRQYIQFSSNQEDNKITFNCQGYMFTDWNSTNGYIQNPAYILAFYLSLIMEAPINWIDLDAIDALAQIFEDGGWGTAGKLAITTLEAPEAILQKMLYCFGVKFWQKRDGMIAMGRKDISNLETDLFFHAQIDTSKHPEKNFNLTEAVNSVQIMWNYHPAADIYEGARTAKDEASIALFGDDEGEGEMGPPEPWEFPWVTSASLVRQRVLEDLLKLAYGDKRIKIDIPMDRIADIEIFDNIRVQDPYGLSWTKSGELGRYYYVLSLTYNWTARTITVEAADLQWLLQQYFIFGDEDAMPQYWTDARATTYAIYGYLCDEDTFKFSDGTSGKYLIDENIIDQE